MSQPAEGFRWPDAPAGLELPDWLAQLVVALRDGQRPAAGRSWLARIRAEAGRLGGRVPFGVVHDWHASTVLPLLAAAGLAEAGPAGALHAEALAGRPAGPAAWAAALEPALREIYRRAYGYPEAYAANYASAHEYGMANGFGEQGTAEYAGYYAELATGANLRAAAGANAIANARAAAAAFATADPVAYARCYPYAAARAYALALADNAGASGRPGWAAARAAAYATLADGLAAALARAEPATG